MIAVYIWIVALSLAIVILMIEDDSNKREMRILKKKVDELEDYIWKVREMVAPFPTISSPVITYDGNIGYVNRNEGLTEDQYKTLVEAERAAHKLLANSRK